MQVARFWRTKTQRYRLTGYRDEHGNVEFINRDENENDSDKHEETAHIKTESVIAKQPAA
jgi:hypothetical protein